MKIKDLEKIRVHCVNRFNEDEYERTKNLLRTPDGEHQFIVTMVQRLIDLFFCVDNKTAEKILRATLEIIKKGDRSDE